MNHFIFFAPERLPSRFGVDGWIDLGHRNDQSRVVHRVPDDSIYRRSCTHHEHRAPYFIHIVYSPRLSMRNSSIRGDWAKQRIDGASGARLRCSRLPSVKERLTQFLPLLIQLPYLIRAERRTRNAECRDVVRVSVRVHGIDDWFSSGETCVVIFAAVSEEGRALI